MTKNHEIRVCYFTHLSDESGANQSLIDLLKGLQRYNNIFPMVILNRKGPFEENLKKLNIDYKVIRYGNEIGTNNSWLVKISKNLLNIVAYMRIKKVLKKRKINIVHNNSYMTALGIEVAHNMKIPYICHLRDFVWEDHRVKLTHVKKLHQLLCNANKVIAVSKAVRKKYVKETGRKDIDVIYDGIDCKKYTLKKKKYFFKNKCISMCIVGKITKGKGQLEAVKVMKLLQDKGYKCCLYIVGDNRYKKYKNKLKNYIKENKILNVKFVGQINDVSIIRRKCDIELVCSKAEAMGRVTIESMLSDCITIGAAAAGTKELILNGATGYLYKLNDIIDLFNKIEFAFKHPDQMKSLTTKAQKYAVENFNINDYVQKIYKIYLSMI